MTQSTPNYAEFDDLIGLPGSVTSEKARAEIRRLMTEHGLGFLYNPGGGQFTCRDEQYPLYGFNCQVGTYDDVEDLTALRAAIKAALVGRGAK